MKNKDENKGNFELSHEELAVLSDFERLGNTKASSREEKEKMNYREPYKNATKIRKEQDEKGVVPIGMEDLASISDEIKTSQIKGQQLIEDSFKKEINIDEEEEKQKNQPPIKPDDDYGASKELFSNKDVRVRTELNAKEIRSIAKINFMSDGYKIPSLRAFVDDYMALKISYQRKSREEFISALHAEEKKKRMEAEGEGGGMIDSFLNRFRGGGN